MAKPKRIDGKTNYCGGCEAVVTPDGAPIVQVGEKPEYESSTAYLCFVCVKAALDELTRPDVPS